MAKKPLTTKNTLLLIWNTINFVRKLIINIVFFPILILVLIVGIVALSTEDELRIESGSALVLDLSGNLVDQARRVDPLTQLMRQGNQNSEDTEVLLSDVLYVIENATHDERIGAIVLDLGNMRAGISKLTAVGEALNGFRETGKKVVAIGDWYSRSQYFLASYADEIYLNPRGEVFIDGYAAYNLYFKSALEKLKVNTHVFRVGTYKSAVEPYIRDDMSPAAKEATQLLIDDLWGSYADTVAKNRGIETGELVLDADTYLARLDANDGDSAALAVKQGWVDALMSDEAFRSAMVELVGEDKEEHSFRQVGFHEYHKLVKPQPQFMPVDSVGVIVAKGTILNGFQAPGDIGGKSTSQLIRDARFDDSIKALVLRVDSPGGSAFASEEIRQELLALKAAGKPVVVSMGSMAASGGYWISASADYIYATPTTLTGSIGIFGLMTTFEDSLAAIGVHADGVATSEWAAHSPFRPLSPKLESAIQRNIERGYKEFITLVANERDMTLEQVDAIAQGRVWSGKKALELGLVDEIGDMPQALAKAAELAGMATFDIQLIEQQMSPEELFIQEMFASVSAWLPQQTQQSDVVQSLLRVWTRTLQEIARFDDPKGVYLYCEYCQLQ
ncbi:signal peptide peptidase SppA [Shewanella amazonensis]|uniref:Signal peptide peptidase SppA, 67K type n=1 Tax=Shewanella amazonensis (strain ATCC BAA-1098 / SB2B) TaxID=326297 RepID=A1S6C2_SHEAM|nr:signal peptide peptidase SppA [Shewanella amazonensis]ABL99928.1 signal peptide peptidase SppA, 67K type [Shewanella amazonensis SB2B]